MYKCISCYSSVPKCRKKCVFSVRYLTTGFLYALSLYHHDSSDDHFSGIYRIGSLIK